MEARRHNRKDGRPRRTGFRYCQPCILPEKAGYRGLENQLYRVEIQKFGTETTVTAKWSRDNGSVAARIEGIAGQNGQRQ